MILRILKIIENYLMIFGLLLNLIGAILLAISISPASVFVGEVDNIKTKWWHLAKYHKIRFKVGLIFLIAGFLLQIIYLLIELL